MYSYTIFNTIVVIGYQFRTHCNSINVLILIYYEINYNNVFTLNNIVIVNICDKIVSYKKNTLVDLYRLKCILY